ncbi:hypothetical protein HZS_2482 [Henneguya salminicola]|nr:hypothetical protein HZS_2482 [Henneguya salminicola]
MKCQACKNGRSPRTCEFLTYIYSQWHTNGLFSPEKKHQIIFFGQIVVEGRVNGETPKIFIQIDESLFRRKIKYDGRRILIACKNITHENREEWLVLNEACKKEMNPHRNFGLTIPRPEIFGMMKCLRGDG